MGSTQIPINSGFGAHTTAQQALDGADLSGEIAIVTGGASGLGLETTRALASAGATVIVAARVPDRVRQALAGIARVELAALDLLEPASIAAFAQSFVDSGRALHILINNAGVMAAPLERDGRGYETQFSANHLGHFQLTAQLLPSLLKADGARVVALSSRGHRYGGVDFDDPNFERRAYDKWQAYGQSKSANALFALELDRRGAAHGIRAFSVHPGRIIDTGLARHLSNDELRAAGVLDEHDRVRADSGCKTVEQGAAITVWCAASASLQGMGGVYCEDVDIARAVDADSTEDFGVRPWATDPEAAQRLWAVSETLAGVPFQL